MRTNGVRDGVPNDVTLSRSGWAGSWKVAAVVGAMGLGASAAGAAYEPARFAYAYLFAFVVFLSVALGALFFVLVQRLTHAGWSVTVRRGSELMMRGLPVFIVLVLPILLFTSRLYPWDGAQRAAEPMQAGAFGNVMDEGQREPLALAAANRDVTAELASARDAEEARVLEHRKPYMNRPFFALRAKCRRMELLPSQKMR